MDNRTMATARLIALVCLAGAVAELGPPAWLLEDPGFEADALAPSPTHGWFSADVATGRLRAGPDAERRVEGRRSLCVEVVDPPRRAGRERASRVSQVARRAPGGGAGGDLEVSLAMYAERSRCTRVVVDLWDEGRPGRTLAAHPVRLRGGAWTRVVVPLTAPADRDRLRVSVELSGEPGCRLWLDDAHLRGR